MGPNLTLGIKKVNFKSNNTYFFSLVSKMYNLDVRTVIEFCMQVYCVIMHLVIAKEIGYFFPSKNESSKKSNFG